MCDSLLNKYILVARFIFQYIQIEFLKINNITKIIDIRYFSFMMCYNL